ncbi:glycosyltransferase [Planctomyces sp. SH-PL62]|uniref:glycosyltransferase n=1 Tax=Planctomyces sp. SH-PL62 TaxID=1636152 RepID=UPI00078EA2DB|nr:glycosyltransferase [Planctomyces sp. SH-PL62]AMV40922.1 Alpha-D-kanosaminyltransferase [Planctomyces sp. SH-PL62]
MNDSPASTPVEPAPLRVAYLVNTYPTTSGSFIRREIRGVEAQAGPVARFTLRRWDTPLVDPDDLEEDRKTQAVLEVGAVGLVKALGKSALTRPGRFLRALRQAATLGRRGRSSGQGSLRHLIYLAEACVLLDWHREAATDHVHVHFGTNSTTVALLCRTLGGPPFSFTAHGPEEFDKPLALGLDHKVRGSAFAVAVSEFGRSQLSRWVDYDQWPKLAVVHCGLDPLFLEAEPTPPPAARRLICVARLAEQKGLPILIEAAGRLKAEGVDFELTIVGDGPLRGEIEALIGRLGLGDSVRLLGWKGGPEVRELLLEHRALVLPSFAEGLPVVIMESLALGRPVVTTWVAGIPELVQPGVNGWLVPPSSVGALADAMREVLDAPVEQLDAMGRRGAARAAERHDAIVEAGKIVGLIRAGLAGEAGVGDQAERPRR